MDGVGLPAWKQGHLPFKVFVCPITVHYSLYDNKCIELN